LFELASLGSDVRLDTVVSVGVGDGSLVSEVSQSFSGLGSAKQYGARSRWCLKSELIECQAFSTSGDNSLSGIFSETKSADRHFRALQHAHIVGYLSNENSGLSFLLRHILRKSVKTNRRLIDLTHVKALQDSCTELGLGSARQELVELDQETVVRILGLDNLHGALVPRAASTSFQIDTHF
jgi:hypothetical protein